MTLSIRPLLPGEQKRFFQRIVETSWNDLLPLTRAAITPEAMAPGLERVVELLMEQGDNVILIADTPEQSNVGQAWLGEARDVYTGQRRGYLYDLFVEPAARGQGVGRALLEAVEAASRARGDRELCLTVAWHNDSAKALYKAFGFETERLNLVKSLEA